MAKLENLMLKVEIRHIRDIKRATKAIKRMTAALEIFNRSSEEATAIMADFKNALPVLQEIELKDEK